MLLLFSFIRSVQTQQKTSFNAIRKTSSCRQINTTTCNIANLLAEFKKTFLTSSSCKYKIVQTDTYNIKTAFTMTSTYWKGHSDKRSKLVFSLGLAWLLCMHNHNNMSEQTNHTLKKLGSTPFCVLCVEWISFMLSRLADMAACGCCLALHSYRHKIRASSFLLLQLLLVGGSSSSCW